MTKFSLKTVRFASGLNLVALLSASLPSLVVFAGSLEQSTAFFPMSRGQRPRLERPSPLAERASAAFAVLPAIKGGAALQPVRRRFSRPDEEAISAVLPVCGQAPDSNSFGCYNLSTGESLADLPIPGQLTTTPQFHEGAWYVGTSRGFFIRFEASGVFMTPNFGVDSLLFHGPDARSVMKSLTQTASVSPQVQDSAAQSFRSGFRAAWSWYATANAEFVGTPQFGGGRAFVLTANQSLNAYDLQTGKLVWGARLAPEVQLRLLSTSLVYHERGLLVGTNDGHLLLLDPKNGQSLWRHSVAGAAGDRFSAVAAPALALSDGIVVSNAESLTQRLNWQSRSAEWSYAVGSVVQAKSDDGSVYIAGSDGALHKLDVRTGQLRWRKSLPVTSPLVAITLLKKQDIVLAATASGSVFAVRMSGGELEDMSPSSSFGAVVGDFFAGRNETGEVCLSYRTPGYACWVWQAGSGSKTHGR